jgi:hypothetical protein
MTQPLSWQRRTIGKKLNDYFLNREIKLTEVRSRLLWGQAGQETPLLKRSHVANCISGIDSEI